MRRLLWTAAWPTRGSRCTNESKLTLLPTVPIVLSGFELLQLLQRISIQNPCLCLSSCFNNVLPLGLTNAFLYISFSVPYYVFLSVHMHFSSLPSPSCSPHVSFFFRRLYFPGCLVFFPIVLDQILFSQVIYSFYSVSFSDV